MKKLVYVLVSILLIALSVLGCSSTRSINSANSKTFTKELYMSQNKLTKYVTTKEIDISKIKNPEFIQNINDINKGNGVYCYNNGTFDFSSDKENKILILFNGIDGFYSNISFSLNDSVLTISYKYTVEKGMHKKSMFMIEDTNKKRSYDKIELNNNGHGEGFTSIIS